MTRRQNRAFVLAHLAMVALTVAVFGFLIPSVWP